MPGAQETTRMPAAQLDVLLGLAEGDIRKLLEIQQKYVEF